MLEILVSNMLSQGACLQEILLRAVSLSRESFQRLSHYEKMLDQLFGSSEFRKATIDPLLEKERQIDAIKDRVLRDGRLRTSDRENLNALLSKRSREYQSMSEDFPWARFEPTVCRLIKNYMHERRNYLQLGDSERVRAAFESALAPSAASA